MNRFFLLFFLSSTALASPLFEYRNCDNALLYDLEVARYWDAKMEETFPFLFNHVLSTGYFTTFSARMEKEGDFGIGGGHIPPYNLISGRFQLFNSFELSANYRIFQGVKDEGLGEKFGNYADRGANFKYAIIRPEDTDLALPGLAIGIEDFMGSKKFRNYFIVATKLWPTVGVETTAGWGAGRYTHGPSNGFFGAAAWHPFWDEENPWTRGISLAAEFDPTNYSNDPSPFGRSSNTPINFGLQYDYKSLLHLSGCLLRGEAFAIAGSVRFNWGTPNGFLPKVLDPLPYTGPRNIEPIGCLRPEATMIQELNYVLESQGFLLIKAFINCQTNDHLTLYVINNRYRREPVMRDRLVRILGNLLPTNIEEVTVLIESYGLPCQQYVFPRWLMQRYCACLMGPFEFDILTPRLEAKCPCAPREIFSQRLEWWRGRVSPRLESFFGSASGKYKYDLGIKAECEGFLPGRIFYDTQISYTVASNIQDVGDFDRYNPSQLPNVLTDYVNYRKQSIFSTDRIYLQRSWNLGRGFFARASAGYFQVNYAGLAGEVLYYPANSLLAFGAEGAILKKRRYTGLLFQSQLRKLQGTTPTYIPYNFLEQGFINAYLDIPDWKIAAKVGVGYFLARDKGLRVELTRYFENGLRVTGWLTYTNAGDFVNGEEYYNRGIALELPIDLISRCSKKRVWNYGMAAWLRDAGAFIPTGITLFDVLNRERRW